MTQRNIEWVAEMRTKYQIDPTIVLDVGSRNINGSVRSLFPSTQYIGIDMLPGPEVDKVMRGDEIHTIWTASPVDLVICMNTLEHDDHFWETLRQMKSILKPGGYMIICTPTFGFPIHRHPKDYWRMGEDAYREVIFKDFELLELEEQPTKIIDGKGINPCICAIGRKPL